ncbi:beta-lactamase family protein [Stieleria sp. JC731]|uniref:serine hydrolase domain-containing protein n=1 Tax=Pirellulaceae TaxID=2691357 RepID=UPI001E53F135|nr:serine hydrolase domain-containing protein [Stieleria sp. JC731]MCC9603199.1 beta-lactamase family protein [Stieleria sp. JC731]
MHLVSLKIAALAIALPLMCSWTDTAQSETPFDSIDRFTQKAVDDGKVAGGCLLVYHGGKVVHQVAFGYADRESHRPFEIDTPVVIASISKPILSTLLHHLVDQDKLDLDAPIAEYLPEFSSCRLESGALLDRSPTTTELITHTSGIRPDEAADGRVWYQSWTADQSLEYVVKRIADDFPFKHQPGEKFAYSGIGTEVAARVGEVVTERTRNEMLQEYFCAPLGLTATYYRDRSALESLDVQPATRYYRGAKSGKLFRSNERPVPEANRYSSSGGSIISSAPDLLTWLLMIRNGGRHDGGTYLSKESHTHFVTEHEIGYAAKGGMFIRRRDDFGNPARYSHTGSSGTNVWIDFEQDTIGIMLTQTRGSDIREFRKELERRVTESVAMLDAVPID